MTFLRYSCIDAEPSGVILTLSGPERQEKYQFCCVSLRAST